MSKEFNALATDTTRETTGSINVTAISTSSSTNGPTGENPWDIPMPDTPRGPIQIDGRECIGRVAAPPGQEATSGTLCFWIPDDALVEATQIVSVQSRVAGTDIRYYALVDEVHRCSRRRGMGQEVDEYDGDLAAEPPFAPEGITYANAAVLRTEPAYLTPPRERAPVFLATEEEARSAYGVGPDEVENPLAIGLFKNGGSGTLGPGIIDTDYLLGANGGHLNVNGAAGRGTKSSFLLHIVYLLLAEVQRQIGTLGPSASERLRIVPIIFNVKGYDLFYIDRLSSRFDATKDIAPWVDLGIDHPGPFEGVSFFAPQKPTNSNGTSIPGRGSEIQAYSWGLGDIIANGLLPYIFAEEDMNDNFLTLVLDLEDWLTEETPLGTGGSSRTLRTRTGVNNNPIDTFERLSEWVREWARDPDSILDSPSGQHNRATIQKLARRLRLIVLTSHGVLRLEESTGSPLNVRQTDTTIGPTVIDLNSLAGSPGLQRFVVATVLRQLVDAQTTSPIPGLKYLIVLDELNRFAPRGGRDPITKLVELVASEMRSQGILLFGAQQQASLVSEKVIENAGIRALGKTGMLELSNSVWRSLSPAAKARADALRPEEKLVLQDTFRQPMYLFIPKPNWAMRRAEAISTNDSSNDKDTEVFVQSFIDE